jgi:endo-1,4-beta-mannosidase
MNHEPFVLGVNYCPRRKAMYWWSDFDPIEVRDEFDIIREVGLSMVRIFLLWEHFQPTPDRVDSDALRHFGQACDIAGERGLKLNVTFFTGHMSGPSWAPRWMLCPHLPPPPGVRQVVSGGRSVHVGYISPYAEPVAMEAARLLLQTVVGNFKDHPAIGIWNLGNEPDLFAWPANAAEGRAWAKRLTGLIHEIDAVHPVTCGLHMVNLLVDNGLRVNDVFTEVDLAVMHGYPMYADWAAGPLDPDFVPFLCSLTSALCNKPTMMEEFGGPTMPPGEPSSVMEWTSYGRPRRQFLASEGELAACFDSVLPKLVEAGATGALLWCFADYDPKLYHRPPCDESWHERFFGLVRPDGSLKPHAEVIRRFSSTDPMVRPARRLVTLDVTPEEYYTDPMRHAREAYQRFRLDGASTPS